MSLIIKCKEAYLTKSLDKCHITYRVEKRVKVGRNYLPPTDLILKKGDIEKSSKEGCGIRVCLPFVRTRVK